MPLPTFSCRFSHRRWWSPAEVHVGCPHGLSTWTIQTFEVLSAKRPRQAPHSCPGDPLDRLMKGAMLGAAFWHLVPHLVTQEHGVLAMRKAPLRPGTRPVGAARLAVITSTDGPGFAATPGWRPAAPRPARRSACERGAVHVGAMTESACPAYLLTYLLT